MHKNDRIRVDRLKAEMAISGFDSQESLAKTLGLGQSAISKIMTGNTINSRYIPRIAELLNVTPGWLLGTSDIRDAPASGLFYDDIAQDLNSFLVPEINVPYAMGAGAFIEDAACHRVPVPKNWIRHAIKGTLDEVFVAYPVGDSMMPTLQDGDPVIVDRSQQVITSQDRIWCISYGELGMIKRIRKLPDGGYLISSDNPAVDPFTAYDGEMHVVGRVVWMGRRI
jgi:phage repressor protein C with HTH and peptisase S24 domain